ncbi:MAG: hypothetical protein ACIAQU_03065 [Phycisphaerales bacterium JB064]
MASCSRPELRFVLLFAYAMVPLVGGCVRDVKVRTGNLAIREVRRILLLHLDSLPHQPTRP